VRYVESDLPIGALTALSEKQGNSRGLARQTRDWWARRLGKGRCARFAAKPVGLAMGCVAMAEESQRACRDLPGLPV
jgi:hypothetical protein